jgi:hypothetical protein
MEEITDFAVTDTIPIPMLDIERKTLPVFCPWCNRIAGIAKTDVVRFDKISPAYRACGKCQDFINEGMVFIRGGNSSLSRWLVSFCRQMWVFREK